MFVLMIVIMSDNMLPITESQTQPCHVTIKLIQAQRNTVGVFMKSVHLKLTLSQSTPNPNQTL